MSAEAEQQFQEQVSQAEEAAKSELESQLSEAETEFETELTEAESAASQQFEASVTEAKRSAQRAYEAAVEKERLAAQTAITLQIRKGRVRGRREIVGATRLALRREKMAYLRQYGVQLTPRQARELVGQARIEKAKAKGKLEEQLGEAREKAQKELVKWETEERKKFTEETATWEVKERKAFAEKLSTWKGKEKVKFREWKTEQLTLGLVTIAAEKRRVRTEFYTRIVAPTKKAEAIAEKQSKLTLEQAAKGIQARFGKMKGEKGYDPVYDLNWDQIIDTADLAIVASQQPKVIQITAEDLAKFDVAAPYGRITHRDIRALQKAGKLTPEVRQKIKVIRTATEAGAYVDISKLELPEGAKITGVEAVEGEIQFKLKAASWKDITFTGWLVKQAEKEKAALPPIFSVMGRPGEGWASMAAFVGIFESTLSFAEMIGRSAVTTVTTGKPQLVAPEVIHAPPTTLSYILEPEAIEEIHPDLRQAYLRGSIAGTLVEAYLLGKVEAKVTPYVKAGVVKAGKAVKIVGVKAISKTVSVVAPKVEPLAKFTLGIERYEFYKTGIWRHVWATKIAVPKKYIISGLKSLEVVPKKIAPKPYMLLKTVYGPQILRPQVILKPTWTYYTAKYMPRVAPRLHVPAFIAQTRPYMLAKTVYAPNILQLQKILAPSLKYYGAKLGVSMPKPSFPSIKAINKWALGEERYIFGRYVAAPYYKGKIATVFKLPGFPKPTIVKPMPYLETKAFGKVVAGKIRYALKIPTPTKAYKPMTSFVTSVSKSGTATMQQITKTITKAPVAPMVVPKLPTRKVVPKVKAVTVAVSKIISPKVKKKKIPFLVAYTGQPFPPIYKPKKKVTLLTVLKPYPEEKKETVRPVPVALLKHWEITAAKLTPGLRPKTFEGQAQKLKVQAQQAQVQLQKHAQVQVQLQLQKQAQVMKKPAPLRLRLEEPKGRRRRGLEYGAWFFKRHPVPTPEQLLKALAGRKRRR